ncbi:MAG: hypothetical protein N2645_15540 [Clostridia bacterium]|nr:hypothetical protein [Clostridia bacterium]
MGKDSLEKDPLGVIDSKPSSLEKQNGKKSKKSKNKVWLIHGTEDINTSWTGWYPHLTKRIKEFFGGDVEVDTSFNWGTLSKDDNDHRIYHNNDDKSRRKGALELARRVLLWRKSNPEGVLTLIGHSHGGNVCILAANLLGEAVKIDNLITIETPVRGDYLPEADNILNHNQIFNLRDRVQIFAGFNQDETILSPLERTFQVWKRFPKSGQQGASNEFLQGEWGEAARRFGGKTNDIRVITPGDMPGPLQALFDKRTKEALEGATKALVKDPRISIPLLVLYNLKMNVDDIDAHFIAMRCVYVWIERVEPHLRVKGRVNRNYSKDRDIRGFLPYCHQCPFVDTFCVRYDPMNSTPVTNHGEEYTLHDSVVGVTADLYIDRISKRPTPITTLA